MAKHWRGIMDLTGLNQFRINLNTQRYNNEISHEAWVRVTRCIYDTVESAGYTFDDLVKAGQ